MTIQPFAPAERHDLGAHGRELILDARNIGVELQGRGRHRRGGARRLLPAAQGRDHRHRRRKRLRQVGDRPHRDGAADQARDRSARDTRITLDGEDMLKLHDRDARKLRGNEISMIFQEPMSSLNPVYTVGQQIVRGHCTCTTASAASEAMERALRAARGGADSRARRRGSGSIRTSSPAASASA